MSDLQSPWGLVVVPGETLFLALSGVVMVTLPDSSLTFGGLYEYVLQAFNEYALLVLPVAFGFYLFFNLLRFLSGSRMR
jgi:hypothetical protein